MRTFSKSCAKRFEQLKTLKYKSQDYTRLTQDIKADPELDSG
jgi:hypothetical protein